MLKTNMMNIDSVTVFVKAKFKHAKREAHPVGGCDSFENYYETMPGSVISMAVSPKIVSFLK